MTEEPEVTFTSSLVRERFGLRPETLGPNAVARALADASGALGVTPARLVEEIALNGARAEQMLDALVAAIVVGETHFFRNAAQFRALERHILPDILRRNEATRRVRVWSAACASGEETYSLAILLDRLLPSRGGWDVRVIGTDIDSRALAKARLGVYRDWSFRSLPPGLEKWFDRRDNEREVAARVRDLVRFAPLNLAGDPFPPVMGTIDFDLVVCRNVLLYLDRAASARLLDGIFHALAPWGWLVLGAHDLVVADVRRFEPVPVLDTVVFRRLAGAVPAPAMSLSVEATDNDLPPHPVPVAATPPEHADPHLDALYHAAESHADRGELGDALDVVDRLLALRPHDAHAHHLRGLLLRELGEPSAALDALRRAVYEAPQLIMPRLALGSALADAGQSRRAARLIVALSRQLSSLPQDERVDGPAGPRAGEVLQLARARLRVFEEDDHG